MNQKVNHVVSLFDGTRSSVDVAKIVGLSPRYVRRIATKFDLPRLHCGAQPHDNNHQFVCGRRVDPDGYVLVTAPNNHPHARKRAQRTGKLIFEHRLALEEKLGRYLLPTEVAHHIDGLTLHNDPLNLGIFDKNSLHLMETLSGIQKEISKSGRKNISLKNHPDTARQPVDIYSLRRARGDVRLRQILLAALKLGIDSPFLLGTHRQLEKKQIDWTSRPNLERALDDLNLRWEADLLL